MCAEREGEDMGMGKPETPTDTERFDLQPREKLGLMYQYKTRALRRKRIKQHKITSVSVAVSRSLPRVSERGNCVGTMGKGLQGRAGAVCATLRADKFQQKALNKSTLSAAELSRGAGFQKPNKPRG